MPLGDLTADEAEEALAKYGPDDLAYALKYAATHDVDPVWRAALADAQAREGGGGRKSRDHRRGRRG
jgi:hypothetical protein